MPTNDKHKPLVVFRIGGTMRQKAIARAWKHTDRSNAKIRWLYIFLYILPLSNHGLNGVIMHLIDFEVFKKKSTERVGNLVKYTAIYKQTIVGPNSKPFTSGLL